MDIFLFSPYEQCPDCVCKSTILYTNAFMFSVFLAKLEGLHYGFLMQD